MIYEINLISRVQRFFLLPRWFRWIGEDEFLEILKIAKNNHLIYRIYSQKRKGETIKFIEFETSIL